MGLHTVPSSLREQLKKPWGQLLTPPHTTAKIRSAARGAHLIVAVGDASTETLLACSSPPDVFVVDGLEMKVTRDIPNAPFRSDFRVKNPAGSISDEAITALMKALEAEKPSRVLVEGEEDLLSLVVISFYPAGTVLFYGQPKKGLVRVNVDERKNGALLVLEASGVKVTRIAVN